MITKNVLMEYNDLCAQVVETEEQLKRLIAAESEVLHDSVKGSNPEYPYEPITFHIAGIARHVDNSAIKEMRHILTARRDAVVSKRLEVEMWINTIPVRMQRIIRMKFFDCLTWEDVANRMGRGVTGDAIRKEFNAFIRKYK